MHNRKAQTAIAIALSGALLAGCGKAPADEKPPSGAETPASPVQPRPVSKAERADLPKATTHAMLRKAPADPKPSQPSKGRVLHPTKPQVLYTRPGGPPLAMLPTTQIKNPTWVPVVKRRPGWARVLLPSRPNGSTGWVHTAGEGLKIRHSPYLMRVQLETQRLTVNKGGRQLGKWKVAIGASDTPTPTGRTFVLASLAPKEPTYSRLILPLGAHSDTLTTYGGGPGTVGFHTWQDPSVYGKAVTHGCIRVPKPALRVLEEVPLGSLVLITE